MGVTKRNGYTLTIKNIRKGRHKDMKYYAVDYNGNLRRISKKRFRKDNMVTSMNDGSNREMIVAYEDTNYMLMTDSANDIDIIKNAILKMLQPNISFYIE